MNIDRRSFLKGALVSGAAVATTGLAACAPQSEGSEGATSGGASSGSAVATEMQAANGKYSWEIAPAAIDASQINETVDVDIIIVGAGAAGVFAAQSAAEEGAKVIVLEKTEMVQGRGLDIGTINSTFQQENDLMKYIDATSAEEIFYEWAHCKVDRHMFRIWAENSGEIFDYYADYLKTNYNLEPSLSATAIPSHYDADPNFRELPTCQSFGQGWYDEEGNWLMVGVVNKIADWATELGAEFHFNTTAEQLVRDGDGPVTAVVAQTKDGYVQYNAEKAVILATGDISGNVEMIEKWNPMSLDVDAVAYTPPGANTGDGIKMGLWIGADVQKGPAAPMIHPLPVKSGPLSQNGDLGFLCVNINGDRYSNEYNNTPGICNARLNQPGSIAYTIFDGEYKDKALQQVPSNMSLMGMPIIDDTTQDMIDAAVAANDGTCYQADTIEDLAKQLGADPSVLSATIARYNEMVAQGEDTDMGTPAQWLTSVDTPPFYASWIAATTLVCVFGLNCDSHSRVCDTDDKAIEGLYAIGNVQGNFFADDYPLICPGISHGRCMTFGYMLPKAIMKGELI